MNSETNSSNLGSHPSWVLLIAIGVVVLGTAWIDPARLVLLLVPASFLVAAYGAGTLVNRAIGGLQPGFDRPPILDLAVSVAVGIACLALLAVLTALGGVLWITGLVAFPLAAFGLLCLFRIGVRIIPWRQLLAPAVGGLVMGMAWLLAWLWATIPPTFFDELAYHLVIPQRALATGELLSAPWVFFTLMPHASDLLLAWGMALGGDLGARGTQFALWVACSLAAWGLAEAIAWPKPARWAAPLIAGALATSPTLWFLATLPFAETCLAVAVVAAAAILASPGDEGRPWLLFGLLLGLGATVKLSGLVWAMGGLAAALACGWPRREVARSALIAVGSVAPWWARAFVHTGNPIYPMAYDLLGGSLWSHENQARVMGDLPYGTGGLKGWALLRLPIDLVQHPERFGSGSGVGMAAVTATCLLLAFPIVSRAAGLADRWRRLGDAVAIFIVITGAAWVITSPTTRFFAPVWVLSLAILAGAVMHLGRTTQIAGMIVFLVAGAAGAARFVDQHSNVFSSSQVALGREGADAYLARQLDHVGAARFVRDNLPANARLLFIGETRPYYFARAAVAPSAYDGHPLHKWVVESSSPEALAGRLAREGITHVVLNVREFKRLHDHYGLLAFSGEGAEASNRRLKALPTALRLLFEENGVYVFEVPKPQGGEK